MSIIGEILTDSYKKGYEDAKKEYERPQGDLISREALKEAINTYDKFACLPRGKLEPFRNLEHPELFEPYVHLRDIQNAIDNASTVEPDTTGYSYGLIDEYNNVMDILRRSNVTVCLEDKRLLTICEYVEMKERGEL